MKSYIRLYSFVQFALFALLFFFASYTAQAQSTTCLGNTSVCVGTTAQYEYNGSSNKIQWTVSGGGTINGNIRSKIITITWNTAGVYSASAADLNGNGADCTTLVSVTTAVGGSVSGTSSVCQGSGTTLTLSGHSGSVVRWESSTNGGGSWSQIANTATTYATGALSSSTAFRAVVNNCSSTLNSSSLTVSVSSNATGSVSQTSGPATFCQGQSVDVTVQWNTAGNGFLKAWEQSTYSAGAWGSWSTAVSNPTGNTYTFSISTPTRYRATVLLSAPCAGVFPVGNYVEINATPPTVAGYISGVTEVCAGIPFSLSINGNTGTVLAWYQRDETHGWASLASTSGITISRTTYYKALIQYGSCPSAETPEYAVTYKPNPTVGTLSVAASACAGSNYSIDLSTFSGNSVKWQRRPAGTSTWTPVIENTNLSYPDTNLQSAWDWQVIITNSCGTIPSNIVTITPQFANPVAGSIAVISGASSFCVGETATGIIKASGFSGQLKLLEKSEYNGSTWSAWEPSTATLNIDEFSFSTSIRTQYRSRVLSNSPCTSGLLIYSAPIEITQTAATQAGYLSGPAKVCSGQSFGIAINNNAGTVQSWLRSTDQINWVTATPTGITISQKTYFKAAVKNGGCSTVLETNPGFYVDVYAAPTAGTLSPVTQSICYNSSFTVTLASFSGQSIRWQTKLSGTDDDWATAVENTSLTYTRSNVVKALDVRALIVNQCNATLASGTVKINVTALPEKPLNLTSDWSYSATSQQITLTVGIPQENNTAHWYTNAEATGIPVYSGSKYTLPLPMTTFTYYVRVWDEFHFDCVSEATVIAVPQFPLIPPSKLKTEVIRVKGITTDVQIDALSEADKSTGYTYFDGMGRPLQSVVQKASPAGNDMVQPYEYDVFGRSSKNYLSYTAATTDGSYQSASAAAQASFYNASGDKIINDAKPYAVTVHEPSPLGRVTEQGNTGTSWQPGTSHSARLVYSYNTGAATVAEEVRIFNADGTSSGFYAANQLSRTQSTDADGNLRLIFRDGSGKTIVQKQQLDQTIDGVMVNWLETYYIYDDLGRIKYMISPKGVAALKANSWSLSTAIRDSYVHQFVYDARGRVAEKKTPGQAWNYVVYDKLNRVVLTQDGLLRAANKWAFLKYDRRGRAVMQGVYTNATQTTRAALQQLADNLYKISNTNYPVNAWFETRGTVLHGYSNTSFPKTNADNSALEVWNVSYYDNYDFDNNGTADYSYTAQALANENTPTSFTNGLATGAKKLILGTATWLYTYVFYDEYGRAIQVRSNNQLSSTVDNLTTSVYDYEGKVIQSKTVHKGGTGKENTILQRQSYDNSGRLKNIYRPVAQAENIVWTNGTGIVTVASSIQKTSGAANWDAGAFSSNSLAAGQDGWMEFSTREANTSKMAGLSGQDVGVSYKTINYAINLTSNGSVKIYENDVLITTPLITYTAADVFSLERKNGVIRYKKNNAIIYTSATASTGALFADASLYTLNATVSNVTFYREVEKAVIQYDYNELGQMVDKKLHNTTGTTFLQSVDYRYTLHGEIASINNAQLTSDGTTTNDDIDDYFGMEYVYNDAVSGLGNTALYNGNISAVKWKGAGSTPGATDQKSYTYSYDKSGKLLTATSQMYATAWNKEANAMNESMSYDQNGNIKGLQRNQRKHQLSGLIASYVSEATDNLTYSYNGTTGDQLEKVTDAATPLIEAGFSNGSSGTSTDYTYDVNGNAQTDLNKGISGITYNLLGKPAQVNFTDGKKIDYVYDATGNKLTIKTWQGATLLTTTDYVNGFQYENGALNTYAAPEGRVVMKGTYPEYQYAIADQQGNTRIVFSSAPVVVQAKTAGMEEVSNADFQNYPTGGSRNSVSIYNHTTGGTYSQLLNGGNNSQVGLAKSYKVYPGDKVKIEAYAKYANPTSNSSNVSAFASALLNAFLLPAPVGGELGTASSALNSWGSVVAAGGDGQSNAAPHVSVNIILFDKNYKFLDAAYDQIAGTAQQVGVSPVVAHDYMTKEYTVKEEGYVFMYIANENQTQVDAYFDDVAMTYTPTSVVQYNEYYPFGLQASTSWTRDTNGNNYLYNEGNELNSKTGWYETFFRGYDPALGRFMQVDPMATKYASHSSYNYGFNNPIHFNDPNGADAKPTDNDGISDIALARMAAIYNYTGWSTDGGGVMMGQAILMQQVYDRQLLSSARSGNADALNQYVASYGLNHEESMQFFATLLKGTYNGGNEIFVNPGRPDANGGMLVNGIPYVISLKSASAAILSNGSFWDTNMGRDVSKFGNNLSDIQPGVDKFGDWGGFIISEVEAPFILRANELGLLDDLNRIPQSIKARALGSWTKGALTGLKAGTKGLGAAGLAIGAGVSLYSLGTGNGELSDLADLAVMGVGALAIGAAGIAAAPYVAVGGLIYGGVMLFGGEDYINNSSFGKSVKSIVKF